MTDETTPTSDVSLTSLGDAPLEEADVILGTSITLEDIQQKIRMLTAPDCPHLPSAAKELQAALLANPEAAALLLPEDVGAAVEVLMRIKNIVVAEDTRKSAAKDVKKAIAKVDLSDAATLQKALDDF